MILACILNISYFHSLISITKIDDSDNILYFESINAQKRTFKGRGMGVCK